MGSFCYTCSLTSQTIRPNDEVFYVEFKEGKDLYAELGRLSSFLSVKDGISSVLEEIKPRNIIQLGWGKYNDYGGVDDLEGEFVMFHKEAVESFTLEIEGDLNILLKVLSVMMTCRKTLVNHALLGRQYPDEESLNLHDQLLKVSRKILDQIVDQYD